MARSRPERPRSAPFSSRRASPLAGGGFYRAPCRAALPGVAARGRSSAPTGRGDARGRGAAGPAPRPLFFLFIFLFFVCSFWHLCELPAAGRALEPTVRSLGEACWGERGADLLLQSLPQPNRSRRPALTSAPPARRPKTRAPRAGARASPGARRSILPGDGAPGQGAPAGSIPSPFLPPSPPHSFFFLPSFFLIFFFHFSFFPLSSPFFFYFFPFY